MQEGLKALEVLLDPYDWFYDVFVEGLRYVVYVHTLDKSQDEIIPDRMMGRQVLVHFATNAPNFKSDYVNKIEKPYSTFEKTLYQSTPVEKVAPDNVHGIDFLCGELDRLERICGTNILGEIFFECHDGVNAVTNLSNKYPEVRKEMNALYAKYGFDSIYDELEL